MFVEVGVGMGKMLVYFFFVISYVRYVGKFVIIVCVDEILIEQLVKKEGDILKLVEYLDLKIDIRLLKLYE